MFVHIFYFLINNISNDIKILAHIKLIELYILSQRLGNDILYYIPFSLMLINLRPF